MMPTPEKLGPSDAVLLRYLLGALPVDEAEPIEEASIVDEDLAARLNAMEHDLVDSYVRGELQGPNLAKFQSWYLSSPLRAQKVEAARAFVLVADAVVEAPVEVAPVAKPAAEANATSATSIAPKFSYGEGSPAPRLGGLRLGMFRSWPVLGFATAVLLLIVAVGFLATRNKHLHNEIAETKTEPAESVAKSNQEPASATVNSQKAGASANLAQSLDNVATVTMFLPAPTRGASTIPTINLPPGTGLVVLSLGLGSNDEKLYRAQLMDPSAQKVLWHSGLLRPGSDGTYVSVTVPANLLRSKTYLIQLTHDTASGSSELLASYPFRADVK